MGFMVIGDGKPVLCLDNTPKLGRNWMAKTLVPELRQKLGLSRQAINKRSQGGRCRSRNEVQIVAFGQRNEGCIIIIRMRHENSTSTRHVDQTVSIVSTIRDRQTCKVLWGYNGISKGWKIVHWNVICRPVRERKNKHAKHRGCHCWRSAIGTRNRERGLEVNRVTQDKYIVRCADVGAWFTLCLMRDVGSNARHGTSMLLGMSNRMDNYIG
jgi:hypothetical protein